MIFLNKRAAAVALGVVALVFVAVIIVGFYLTKHQGEQAGSHTDKAVFRFNESVAPGWWSDGSIEQSVDDFTDDQVTKDNLAASLITVNRGDRGKSADCFATYYYWNKPVDPGAALQEMVRRSTEGDDSVKLILLRSHTIRIDTSSGTREVQMHQYEFTGAGSKTRAKGAQFGYANLENGHIEIRGYCNEANQLEGTLAGLRSVSLRIK